MRNLILYFFFAVIGFGFQKPGIAAQSPGDFFVITDTLNREVRIPLPLERIIVVNTATAIILRAMGVDIENIIVGVTRYIKENPKFWPKLNNKPGIYFTNPSYETLAELNPQVVFFYKTSPMYVNEKKLVSLGITSVYLDCFDSRTLDNDIRTLGRLFRKEKQAQDLIDWYQKYDQMISKRIALIKPEDRPKVFHYIYPDANLAKGIYNTCNKFKDSHVLIEKAGGTNIATDLFLGDTNVSQEWIIEKNPDVILASVIGKNFSGYNADPEKAVENLKHMRQRLLCDRAIQQTDAAKNNRIFVFAQDLKQGPAYIIGLAYIAKYLHPKLFSDIDPTSIAREYYQKWCGLPYQGSYVYP